MGLRDVGFFLRGRLSRAIARAVNRKAPPPAPPAPLEAVLRGPANPLALTRLLEGRDNAGRQAAVARWLHRRGVPFRRHRFATLEGAGENFAVDVGGGDRALVLIAHHDAVPGSPGANDNAAAVAILLSLLDRWSSRPPPTRVRVLFSACEEIGYLGSRAWVREHGVGDVRGVLSLELPGVGDSLAVWDALEPTPFLRTVCATLEGLGLRADEGHHVVGRIPVFGSDHRAFAAAGVPAYGFTSVPAAEAAALRQFVFHPVRSAIRASVRRPPPFDTYHTARDTGVMLDPAALDRMAAALTAVVETA
ncbi:MAG TPA: M28 family peptidase [Candidatus Binatia bacterium]|nr:M28 family peptidase [Candidatus Binatia bacterium]